jgi:hypothetical protein
MEQAHEFLDAIIILHIKSDTGGVLPPTKLNHIGNFTEYFFLNNNQVTILITVLQDPPQNPYFCGAPAEWQQG